MTKRNGKKIIEGVNMGYFSVGRVKIIFHVKNKMIEENISSCNNVVVNK
jgi:hypothetical protein